MADGSVNSTDAALVEEMYDMYIIGSRARWLKDDVMSAFRVSTRRVSPSAHCLQSYVTQVFHRLPQPDLKQPQAIPHKQSDSLVIWPNSLH